GARGARPAAAPGAPGGGRLRAGPARGTGSRRSEAGMQLRSDVTGLAVVILATGAILGAELGGPWLWLHYLCKPLAMVMIITTLNVPGVRVGRYRTAVLVGMLSSLAGDVLLMLPQDLFVPGLLAFLL